MVMYRIEEEKDLTEEVSALFPLKQQRVYPAVDLTEPPVSQWRRE
jgi:hypothetical protein